MNPTHDGMTAVGLLRSMMSAYLDMPGHLRPGAEWLLISAVGTAMGLTGAAADEWLAEELQEMLAGRC